MSVATDLIQEINVEVGNGLLTMRVQKLGVGPDLVYLHPAGGLMIDPYVMSLSERFTVYAPYFPGCVPGDPYAIHKVDSLWDAVMLYQELFTKLGLQEPIAIGQSFGGMLAAEIASVFPGIFSKVVLLDPIGLWNENYPVANWIATPPPKLPELLFHDPTCAGAVAMFTFPDDLDLTVEIAAGLTWALGCTGKFVWPIPDNGLDKRLFRNTSPTLVVYGDNDKLSSPRYADDFIQHLPNAEKAIIPNCGHIPQVEQPEALAKVVDVFLAGK
jgi:pimeloyl-ACP methyl ester carboxylesterase